MGQPHTLSLVAKLPKTMAQIMGCEACGPLMGAHQVNEETGDVGVALVNAGAEGFDVAGDSIYLPPKGKVTFKVTAKKGSTLSFLCAVHPWMAAHDQGQVGAAAGADRGRCTLATRAGRAAPGSTGSPRSRTNWNPVVNGIDAIHGTRYENTLSSHRHLPGVHARLGRSPRERASASPARCCAPAWATA